MTRIAEQLNGVRARIAQAELRFGRAPGSVHLVAVTKTVPVDTILDAVRAGQHRFGESYVQEAVAKIRRLAGANVEWHFIGPMQSNKTREIAENFSWVHSVDRLKIAQRLNDQRPAQLAPLNVCIQANISGEASKSGVMLADLRPLADAVAMLPRLKLRGLMAIPAPDDDFDRQRAACAPLREALEQLRGAGIDVDTLSMGMSGDLEAAIAEGATLVRVGTAIFGERPQG